MRLRPSITLLALVLTGAASGQEAMVFTADAVNVRAGPSTGQASFGKAQQGQVYPVLGKSGAWVRLQFGERAGWSHGDYLRASTTPVRVVTTATLNVRAGAGTRFRELGELGRGMRVAVRGSSGDWRRIDFAGREAWVHGAYLGPVAAAPQPDARPRSAAGLIQLRASGTGYYSYTTPGRRWGTPRMIYGLERIARRWAATGRPRMGVGDISYMNGGVMSGHPYSHRTGKDADIRPVRTSGEGRVTIRDAAYSRAGTRALFDLTFAELPVQLIAFNDPRIYQPLAKVIYAAGHDNHFHVRIP